MELAQWIFPPLISVVLSGIVSWRVAKYSAERQFELQNDQRKREWYERAITLAERTEDDWWEAMTAWEKEWEVDSVELFRTRREELRQHAAKGEGMGVESEVTDEMQNAALSLGAAIEALGTGEELAKIEREQLLPEIDEIKTRAREHIDE